MRGMQECLDGDGRKTSPSSLSLLAPRPMDARERQGAETRERKKGIKSRQGSARKEVVSQMMYVAACLDMLCL